MEQTAILDFLNKIDELLIKNVRAEMLKRKWSQSDLARKIGRDPNKVSRFLTKGSWDSDLLLDLSLALDIPVWQLLMEAAEQITPDRAVEIVAEFVKKNWPPRKS